MNQNSTAAHRPVVLMTTAPDTALWPPDYPDRDSDRDATSHPAMKIRHLNPRQMVSIPEQRVTVRHPVLKAPPGEMRHTAEFMNRPGRPATTANHSAPAAAGRPHSAGADHRGGCGPAPQSHPAFLPAASPPATSGNTPPAHRRYSRRENIFPLRRSHHEAARLRWRIAGRAPESLILSLSWDLLRKFVNGKEAAKVADVIAELTAAQAFAAFILRDIGRRLVIFIRDRRTVITALITAIGPGAGVGQHDTSRKNGTVRFRRRGQYKRGTHRAQFAALLDAPAADHLLLRIGVTVSVDEVHRIQKTGVNLTPDHRSSDQTLQVFRHPGDHAVQVRNRQCRTGSTALAVQFKSRPLNGIRLILSPCQVTGSPFSFCSLQKK